MNPESAIYPKAAPANGLLWARSGKNVGRRYPLGPGELILGRASSSDIEVEDDRASLQHAKLVRVDGRLRLCDLGSTNGTFVNDQRVDEIELHDGDLVQIGETIFEYVAKEDHALTVAATNGTNSVVPSALREGARQMLRRERNTELGRPATERALTPSDRGPEIPVLAPVEVYDRPYYAKGRALDDEEDEEEGMTLMDLLKKVRQVVMFFLPYWKSIVAFSVIGMAVGGVLYAAYPPPRRAVFQLSLDVKAVENPIQNYTRANLSFFSAARENFLSPFLIKKTLSELGIQEITLEGVDGVTKQLEFKQVGLRPMPNAAAASYTYQGEYANVDPKMAVNFLNQHLQNFLETQIDKALKRIQAEADFLEKRVAVAEEDLNIKEKALLDFKQKNVDALPESVRQYYSSVFELERKRSDLRAEISRLSTALAHDSRRLGSEQEYTPQSIQRNRPYDKAIETTKARLATLQAEGKGEAHPEVMAARGELKRLEALAEEAARNSSVTVTEAPNTTRIAVSTSVAELRKQLDIARRDAAFMDAEVARVRGIVDRLPELESTHAELQRRYEAAKTEYTTLVDKLKTAKLQLDLERASTTARYDIIRQPSIEYESMKKPMIMRIISMGILGFMVGLGFATFRRLRGTFKQTLHELALATTPDQK